LALTGATLSMVRKGLQYGSQYGRRKMIVSVELVSKDKSYDWFLRWMSAKIKKTQHLSVATRFHRYDNGNVETKFSFLPSVGAHYIKYKKAWIKVERSREKNVVDLNSGSPWETVTLTMLGRDKSVFINLLEEAKELALKEEEGSTIIYTALGPDWRPFGFPRPRRPFESVILKDGLTQSLLKDVRDFLENSEWYRKRGIPYRRGYLLYGPPGCGKSSFILALAGKLQYNICMLSLSDRGLTDDRLNHLLVVAPQRSIILLEDIDAAIDPDRTKGSSYNHLTFSGLLNALDGVAASEGRILFMTTNKKEKLDLALIRPGRVDRMEFIGLANLTMIKELWTKYYPEQNPNIFDNYNIPDNLFSMAELQGIFLVNKTDPIRALERVEEEGKIKLGVNKKN